MVAAMKLRLLLPLALASLLGCPDESGGGSLTTPSRPANTGTGETRARVHSIDGAVRVHPRAGAAFAAEAGQELLGTDEVVPSPKAWVILELENRHVVRVSGAERMKVEEIALQGLPETNRSVEEQVQALRALPPEREGAAEPTDAKAPDWLQVRFGPFPGAAKTIDAPALVAARADELKTCLAGHVKALGLKRTKLKLYGFVERARIADLALEGAVPVPACAREALHGYPIRGLPNVLGWLVIPVPLS